MQITKEQIDNLNATLIVNIQPDDYSENVKKGLKKIAKNIQMPGFRPGTVPMGIIQKNYGTSVLVEEINKLLQNGIENYINENKLNLLGNALPSLQDEHKQIDWEKEKSFEFKYDIAFAPEINIKLDGLSFERKMPKVESEQIEKTATNIALRYGTMEFPESIEDGDMIYSDFNELDGNGNIVAGGVFNNAPLLVDRIFDENLRNELKGKKVGDVIKINPNQLTDNPTELAATLKIDTSKMAEISSSFQMKITSISRRVPAELNAELFQKVYGSGVETLEQFHEKISNELLDVYKQETDRILMNDIQKTLIEQANIELPVEFLKRWIKAANEKPVSEEDIEKDFDNYARYLKWQLIENKIAIENGIKVEKDEAVNYIKNILGGRLGNESPDEDMELQMTKTALKVLADKEQGENIYRQLFDNKMMAFFENKFNIALKEVSEKELYNI